MDMTPSDFAYASFLAASESNEYESAALCVLLRSKGSIVALFQRGGLTLNLATLRFEELVSDSLERCAVASSRLAFAAMVFETMPNRGDEFKFT
jgi:hypothetical protein